MKSYIGLYLFTFITRPPMGNAQCESNGHVTDEVA